MPLPMGFRSQVLAAVDKGMGRALSRDLRDRVVAAVEAGLSCWQKAERLGVSAASTIRRRQLVLAHGTSGQGQGW